MENREVIARARALGWVPQERNKTARKHFYFDGPVLFSVSILKPRYAHDSFTVGDTTTSYEQRAIEMLEAAAEKGGRCCKNFEDAVMNECDDCCELFRPEKETHA